MGKLFKNSLKRKMITLLIILFLIPLFVQSIVNKDIFFAALANKIQDVSNQSSENLALYLSNCLQSQYDMTINLAKNSEVINSVQNTYFDNEQVFYKLYEIIIQNNKIARSQYPFHFMVFNNNGQMFSNFSFTPKGKHTEIYTSISKEPWFKYLSTSYVNNSIIFVSKHKIFAKAGEQVYMASNIISDGNICGIIAIGIDKSYLSKLLNHSRTNVRYNTYLVDYDGTCLIEGNENELEFDSVRKQNIPNSNDYINNNFNTRRSVVRLSETNYTMTMHDVTLKGYDKQFQLLSITSVRDLLKDINYMNIVSYLLIVLCIFCITLLTLLFNKKVINPIIKMHSLMKEVQHGKLDVFIQINSKDEIGELSHGFNNMTHELKQYIENVKSHEKAKRDSEVKMLQAQMKPHFVRNILNSIRWMAEISGAESISHSILSFSNMLEYNFSNYKMFTTVKNEIEYLNEYIYLQQVRYQNIFFYEQNIDPNILECKILKLCFQPIVENCINHGILPKKRICKIQIYGWRNGDNAVFEISDDGIGMNNDALKDLLTAPDVGEKVDELNNIALWNIDQRIKLNFGEDYGLTVQSAEKYGTTVRLIFPYIEYVSDSL